MSGHRSEDTCFWCGRHARRKSPFEYNPCLTCLGRMSRGITLIEVCSTPTLPRQTPYRDGIFPTGNWWVVEESMIVGRTTPVVQDIILGHRIAMISPQDAITMGLREE